MWNIRKHSKMAYRNICEIFSDFYFGGGVKHNDTPDKIFMYGDIVTTDCGWDLGFHSGVTNRVYARVEPYGGKIGEHPIYGGTLDWYKTGVNVTWDEWQHICKYFEDKMRSNA